MKYIIEHVGIKFAEVEAKNPREAVKKLFPNAKIKYRFGPFTVKVSDGKTYTFLSITNNIENIAFVYLTENDKARIDELYRKYVKKNIIELNKLLCELFLNEIEHNMDLSNHTIRYLLREATSEENSERLKKIFMCIVKGLEYCSDEELNNARIKY